jgi:hypothetical protein
MISQLSSFRFASFAPLRAVSLSEQEAAHVALRAACGGYPASALWHVFRSPPSILKPICPARKLLPDFLKGFTLLKTI